MQKIMKLNSKEIENLNYYLPDKNVLDSLADFFSVFSDSTRLKILSALAINKMCVNDLSVTLNINQTTVSHQLKILKSLNVVNSVRCGKIIYYSLSKAAINDVMLNGVECIIENSA